MSASIPLDVIDPDAAYREWVDRYLWHIDQLPTLVETTSTIALAVRGIRAAPLHERVSGGGYIDNIPVVDGPESRNARAIWEALRGYLVVASSRLGLEGPQLPATLPGDIELAREWAFAANAWLADVVYDIQAWDDLTQLEEHLFRLVRRAHGRLATSTARRTRPELCTRCGENGVLIDWIDGPNGEPRLSKVCVVCRTNYTPAGTSRVGRR